MVHGLQSTVGELHSTMGTAMAGVTTNVERSMQMMSTMNTVMENYLIDSLRVESESHFVPGGSSIHISVCNTCRFPLEGILIGLPLATMDQGEGSSQGSEPNEAFRRAVMEMLPLTLQPGQCQRSTFVVDVPVLQEYVPVDIKLPSPGTGRSLHKTSRLPFTSLDQWGSPSKLEEAAQHGDLIAFGDAMWISAVFLRKWLHIPPVCGLPSNTCYKLRCSDDGHVVTFGLRQPSEDGQRVMLQIKGHQSYREHPAIARLIADLESQQ